MTFEFIEKQVQENFDEDCKNIIAAFQAEFLAENRIAIWNYNLESIPYQNSSFHESNDWLDKFTECWKMRKLMASRTLLDLIMVKIRQEFNRIDYVTMRAQ